MKAGIALNLHIFLIFKAALIPQVEEKVLKVCSWAGTETRCNSSQIRIKLVVIQWWNLKKKNVFPEKPKDYILEMETYQLNIKEEAKSLSGS